MNAPNGYAPPTAQAPQVNINAEIQAEIARFNQAKEAMASQRSSGQGSDVDYYKPKAPQQIGGTEISYVMVLPASLERIGAPPWVATLQHTSFLRGQTTSAVCPLKDAIAANPELAKADPRSLPTCPLCDAAEYVRGISRSYPRESQEGKQWWGRFTGLEAKDRAFMHVFDLDDIQSHWKVDKTSGQARAVPKRWAFGSGVLSTFVGFLGTLGSFWHPQALRRFQITTSRKGPEDRDVRYAVMPVLTDQGPIAIPQGYESVLQNLTDLSFFRRPKPLPEMIAMIPPWATQQQAFAAPQNPYQQQPPSPQQPYQTQSYVAPAAPQGYPPQQYQEPQYAAPPPPFNPAQQAAPPLPPMNYVPSPSQYAPPQPQYAPPPPVPQQYAPPPIQAVPQPPPPAMAMPPPPPPQQYAAPQPPPPSAPMSPPPGMPAMPPLPTTPPGYQAGPTMAPPPPSAPQSAPPVQNGAPPGMPALPPMPPLPPRG